MKKRASIVLPVYRKLLKLYPANYRQEFEAEMLNTMEAMLNDASSRGERWRLLWRACKDYLLSLTRQNMLAFDEIADDMPRYLKRSSYLSTGLVLPFFYVCLYNSLNQYVLKRGVPLLSFESKTWVIYGELLPTIAFGIVIIAGLRNVRYRLSVGRQRFTEHHRSTPYDWVILGMPIALLVTLVLL
jgi:hypothetical protein